MTGTKNGLKRSIQVSGISTFPRYPERSCSGAFSLHKGLSFVRVSERKLAEAQATTRKRLDQLPRMRPAAFWQRRKRSGDWGIVTAVGFCPYTAEELQLP